MKEDKSCDSTSPRLFKTKLISRSVVRYTNKIPINRRIYDLLQMVQRETHPANRPPAPFDPLQPEVQLRGRKMKKEKREIKRKREREKKHGINGIKKKRGQKREREEEKKRKRSR